MVPAAKENGLLWITKNEKSYWPRCVTGKVQAMSEPFSFVISCDVKYNENTKMTGT